MGLYEQVQGTAQAIRARAGGLAPKVGVIPGSGLGGFADDFARKVIIPSSELPHFPHSLVPGHEGRLVLGLVRSEPVVAMQGRVHAYEGYTPAQVVPTVARKEASKA